MRSIAAMVGAGAALALWVSGCGSDDEPNRSGHQPVYGTDIGVFDLSLARDRTGQTLLAWTEGSMGRGTPTWMLLGDERAHTIELPIVAEVDDRTFSPIMAFDGAESTFAWYAAQGFVTNTLMHEVLIGADGTLAKYRSDPSPVGMSWVTLPLVTFPLGANRVAIVGVDPSTLVFEAALATAGDSVGATTVLGSAQDLSQLRIVGTAAAEAFGVVVFTDGDSIHATAVSAVGELVEVVVENATPGFVGQPLGVAANAAGVAVLVSTPSGGLVAYVSETPAEAGIGAAIEGLFDEPAFTLDGVGTEARLFRTNDRFVVVWNQGEGADRHTRAVTLRPGRGAGSVFDWPLDDADCPVHAAIPDGKALQYVCVGRCEGGGCAQRWIYHGRIELGAS